MLFCFLIIQQPAGPGKVVTQVTTQGLHSLIHAIRMLIDSLHEAHTHTHTHIEASGAFGYPAELLALMCFDVGMVCNVRIKASSLGMVLCMMTNDE